MVDMGNAILRADAYVMLGGDTTAKHVYGVVPNRIAQKGALGRDNPDAVKTANSAHVWTEAAG